MGRHCDEWKEAVIEQVSLHTDTLEAHEKTMRTSGTASTFFATRLLSFRPLYLLRWLENSESTARDG